MIKKSDINTKWMRLQGSFIRFDESKPA